mgnify:CR=1 FL=1
MGNPEKLGVKGCFHLESLEDIIIHNFVLFGYNHTVADALAEQINRIRAHSAGHDTVFGAGGTAALDVTPQIDEHDNIILHVHPQVSVVEEKTKNVNLGDLGTFTLPLASSTINETDSIVRVQDGSIVAIGGLMSQEQSNNRYGLPGVSGLPGLGQLFGQKSVSNRKRELVILMRSTVIKGEESWRTAASEAQERLQGMDPRQKRHIEWQ